MFSAYTGYSVHHSKYKGSPDDPGITRCKLLLSLAVLDGVTRYMQNRVFAPRRFHTALHVLRVLELAARRNFFLP